MGGGRMAFEFLSRARSPQPGLGECAEGSTAVQTDGPFFKLLLPFLSSGSQRHCPFLSIVCEVRR